MSAIALALTPPSRGWNEKAQRLAPLLERADTYAAFPDADPVYGALVKHWRSRRALETAPSHRIGPREPGYAAAQAQERVLCRRESVALRALFKTSPTTVGGLLDLLE
jgi:hypothetical protein